ncbi:hypothetical protein ABMY26_06960 (plasmid) [Azospirillum sp. HJ39]
MNRFIIHCSTYVGIVLLILAGAWTAGRLHSVAFGSKPVPVERITHRSAQ